MPREMEDAKVEMLFGSYFYDLLLCVDCIALGFFSPYTTPSGHERARYTFLIIINFNNKFFE